MKRYESPDQPGEFLQVSGFKVEYDTTNPVGHRVIKLQGVNDDGEYENIKPDTVYWVGMSDFIAGGGEFGLPRLKTLDKSPFKVMDSK